MIPTSFPWKRFGTQSGQLVRCQLGTFKLRSYLLSGAIRAERYAGLEETRIIGLTVRTPSESDAVRLRCLYLDSRYPPIFAQVDVSQRAGSSARRGRRVFGGHGMMLRVACVMQGFYMWEYEDCIDGVGLLIDCNTPQSSFHSETFEILA